MSVEEMISEMEMEVGYTPKAWDAIVAKLRAAEELHQQVINETVEDKNYIPNSIFLAAMKYERAGGGG